MNVIDILDYISIKYLIIVILIMEILHQNFKTLAHTQHRKWVIVVVSFVVANAMLLYSWYFMKELNIHTEAGRLFISFLFTVAFYSIIVKPMLVGFKSKFGIQPKPKEENANE